MADLDSRALEAAARALVKAEGHDPDEDWSLAYPNNQHPAPEAAWRFRTTEAKAVLQAYLAAMWRPIEEHDGSTAPVLVASSDGVHEASLTDDGWYRAGSDSTDYWDGSLQPTHFQPLPPVPQPGVAITPA